MNANAADRHVGVVMSAMLSTAFAVRDIATVMAALTESHPEDVEDVTRTGAEVAHSEDWPQEPKRIKDKNLKVIKI